MIDKRITVITKCCQCGFCSFPHSFPFGEKSLCKHPDNKDREVYKDIINKRLNKHCPLPVYSEAIVELDVPDSRIQED